MRSYVFAIDPGTSYSGICLVETESYKPLYVAKVKNSEVAELVFHMLTNPWEYSIMNTNDIQLVIERMHNPMSVDSNVFLTCEWIGRFDVLLSGAFECDSAFLFRFQEYKTLCANLYSRNDKGIKSALVDRFAYGVPNYGKGKKGAPGWFYGFSADVWSAYAIAVTYIDMQKGSH